MSQQEKSEQKTKILIMSCSGAANVGQLSNQVALELVQERFARPFCLAGIGAHRRGFVRAASEAHNIVVDGCAIGCGKTILEHADLPIKTHLVLTDLGIEKKMSSELSRKEIDRAKEIIKELWKTDQAEFSAKEIDTDCSCCS
jgi:uncharacterized metal-binding protein